MTELGPDALSAYLDDELSAPERAEVEARLAASAAWRAELAEVRAGRDAVRELPVRDAPSGFWAAVHAHVAADDARDDARDDAVVVPLTAAPTARRRRWGWIAAAAAAVAVVVAVVVVPQRHEVSPDVTAVVAQHGAQSSDSGDPVTVLAPVGPLAGFRR